MAMKDASRIMNGTYGAVWVDGELWAEAESFSAQVNPEYADVNFLGSPATHKKMLGWAGEGSMTLKRVYSRVQRKAAEAVKNGRTPRFQIVGKLADPDAFGSERVVLNDVTLNDINLLSFEQKTEMSTEISFNFSDYNMPEMV